MNATNRILNRGLLLVVGVALFAAGLLSVLVGTSPAWAGPFLSTLERTARTVGAGIDAAKVDIPGVGVTPGAAPVVSGLGFLLAVAALIFMLTRGGGGTADVLRFDAGANGGTAVDKTVADAVIVDTLRERPDVLSARIASYRVHRRPALALTLSVRRGARLNEVLGAASSAIGRWDSLAGEPIPVMIHIADPRWRDALRSRSRVR